MTFLRRLGLAIAMAATVGTTVEAQTLHFETTAGSFDMKLNPSGDANLQPLVDNMVAYVGLGRFNHTVIDRAETNFVLQMGTYQGWQPDVDYFVQNFQRIERFDPVTTDVNGDRSDDFPTLQNLRGTVSLALSNLSDNTANANSGTSAFFINVIDNSTGDTTDLDDDFVPFAEIADMTTVDAIVALSRATINGSTTSFPIDSNGRLVLINRVTITEAPAGFSMAGAIANALAGAVNDPLPVPASVASAASISNVPEPGSVALSALAGGLLLWARRRRA